MGILILNGSSYLSEIVKTSPSMVVTETVYDDSRMELVKASTQNQTVNYRLNVKNKHKRIVGPNFVFVSFGIETGDKFKLFHDDYHARLLGTDSHVLFTSRSFDPEEFSNYLLDFCEYMKGYGNADED